MLDRQRTRRELDVVRVEDVIPADILNDTRVDRDYLEKVFREPQNFIPPRGREEERPEALEPEEEPESRFARRAKLAGLLAAGALVAGAIVFASTSTGPHRTPLPTADSAPAGLSGAAALGGAAVPGPSTHGAGVGGGQPSTGKQQSSDAPAAETAPGVSPQQLPGTSSAPSTQPSTSQSGLTALTDKQKIDAVHSFYKTIDLNPASALDMLTPLLAYSGPGDLIRAWSSMDAIQVQETTLQPDGSVLAVVTMRQPDGDRLWITQLLRFGDGLSGLITDARLLSAQHM